MNKEIKENQTIIKSLNMYGKVPEQWELLNEIEKLQEENKRLKYQNIYKSRIDKAIEYIEDNDLYFDMVEPQMKELLNILKGE